MTYLILAAIICGIALVLSCFDFEDPVTEAANWMDQPRDVKGRYSESEKRITDIPLEVAKTITPTFIKVADRKLVRAV
jgi:hypothetical protein